MKTTTTVAARKTAGTLVVCATSVTDPRACCTAGGPAAANVHTPRRSHTLTSSSLLFSHARSLAAPLTQLTFVLCSDYSGTRHQCVPRGRQKPGGEWGPLRAAGRRRSLWLLLRRRCARDGDVHTMLLVRLDAASERDARGRGGRQVARIKAQGWRDGKVRLPLPPLPVRRRRHLPRPIEARVCS